MALIDVSEVINDSIFKDTITVVRRAEVINDYGEMTFTTTETIMSAVVQAGNGETLKRNPDYATMSDWITIYAQFDFKTSGNGSYADKIIWNGRSYQIKTVTDYSNWGAGYMRADCMIEGVQ